jgi:hypothetical protein
MMDGTKRINLLLMATAHGLILCGLICVILTDQIPVPLWLCALAAHPLSILMKPKQGRYFFNTIVVLSFSYSLFLFFVLQTPFLMAFTQFLIVVQAVKLFHLDKAKDYFQLAGLGLLTVLAAAGLTSQLYYLFFLFMVLLFGIWLLFLLHMKRAIEQQPALPPPPRALTSPSVFLGVTAVALCSFLITILIFFSLPRITLSVSGREQWGGTSSGFTNVVDLGTVGPVRLDNRVVMRVELPQFKEQPPFPLYWRGTSFSRWNDRTWEKEDTVEKIFRLRGGEFFFHSAVKSEEAIAQVIMLEPLGTDLLFTLSPPLEIRGAFSHLLVDAGGGIHLPSIPQERYSYQVYSASKPWGNKSLESAEKPAAVYLQVPQDKEVITALAHQIVDGATSPDEKVQRVIKYLQNNCSYSLTPKRDERFPPLQDFLFHSRQGYCEHFATAAALLLRGAGMPTRLVSGFFQGEWNPLGRYVMVRQRDAHTWIEVYLPDMGWVPCDPTPAADMQPLPSLMSAAYRYYDFLKLTWNRYIIHYSRRDQIRVLLALQQRMMNLRLLPHAPWLQRAKDKTARSPLYPLAALAALASILVIAAVVKRRKRVITLSPTAKLPAGISFYLKMLKILEKKKVPKRACETPAEFAHRVRSEESDLSPSLERITSLYYRVRFGQIPLTPYEEQETGKIIRYLRKRGPYLLSPRQQTHN